MKPKSQFEFVLQDTEESEFLDLVDFGGVAISVETVSFFQKNRKWKLAVWIQKQENGWPPDRFFFFANFEFFFLLCLKKNVELLEQGKAQKVV